MVWLLCLEAGASYATDNFGHVEYFPKKEFSDEIILKPAKDKNTADVLSQQQQRHTAQGVVIDETGEPIVGASVVVKGVKGLGGITDVNGKFNVTNIPVSAKEIVISYVGMEAQTVPIRSGLMRITLKNDAQVLDEVVVTGMTKMDKRLFTGASASLKSDNVKLDGIADISRSLEGRVAGVSVQNVSGTFGTAPKIIVRGSTSLYVDS